MGRMISKQNVVLPGKPCPERGKSIPFRAFGEGVAEHGKGSALTISPTLQPGFRLVRKGENDR